MILLDPIRRTSGDTVEDELDKHESVQGCQYTSLAFGERCRQSGVAPSMGSVGDCYDNAMAESFFATLECELLDRTRFHDHRQAQGGDLRVYRRMV